MHPAPPSGRLLRRGLTLLREQLRLHPRPFACAVTGAAVFGAGTVATSWAIGRVVDAVVVPRFDEGRVGAAAVMGGALLVIGTAVVKSAGIVCRRVFAGITQARIQASLSTKVVEHYQALPLSYHRSHPTGELMAHAHADCEAGTTIVGPLPYGTGVVVMVVITAVWLFVSDPWLALIGYLVLPAVAALNVVYERTVEPPATEAQQHVGEVSAVAHESFDGALVVKTLGVEDREVARFRAASELLRDARIRVARRRAAFEPLLDALPTLGMVAILCVGTWRISTGAITPGLLVAVVNLFQVMVWPIRLIGFILADLPMSVVGYDRVKGVLAEPLPAAPTAPLRPSPDGPLEVRFDDVVFSYEADRRVLDGVTFSVPAGATVALVGSTGSGKSTISMLLAGLVTADKGEVSVGDVDVALLRPADRARAMALAFQDPFLFGQSVHDNIALGDHAITRADVIAAAELAQADAFIAELPRGYDTVVGERGATLSGGQRQRVALARALVRKPRLLVMDDATSSVDASIEAAILSGLVNRLSTTTTVLVAYRTSTIVLADLVVHLDRGRVAAVGSHQGLSSASPAYARLVSSYARDRAEADR